MPGTGLVQQLLMLTAAAPPQRPDCTQVRFLGLGTCWLSCYRLYRQDNLLLFGIGEGNDMIGVIIVQLEGDHVAGLAFALWSSRLLLFVVEDVRVDPHDFS